MFRIRINVCIPRLFSAPIDIQSILNGAAKFCKHCDVVILNNMIRKKISDLPFLAKDFELVSDGEELYFCSSTCYMQFALMHHPSSISEDKVKVTIIIVTLKRIYFFMFRPPQLAIICLKKIRGKRNLRPTCTTAVQLVNQL